MQLKKKSKLTIQDTRINLMPKDPFYESIIGKMTTWALSVGRYIVIFTELVVILSFLSRFQLDRQVTDLNNEILQKQSIIESYGDLEQNVRDIQKKISVYSQFESRKPIKEVFDELIRITPAEVTFYDLLIENDRVLIAATADSSASLNRFLLNIQANPYFTNVVSDSISNKDSRSGGFDFQIQANFAKEKSDENPEAQGASETQNQLTN